MTDYRVLIIDDQHEVRRMLVSGIKTLDLDLEALDVPSAEEALLVTSFWPVDLLVIDIRLPGISGLELLDRIRKRNPGVKTILVTGLTEPGVRQQVAEADADAYFYKPIVMADFLEAVERCLEPAGPIAADRPVEELIPSPEASQAATSLPERLAGLCESLGLDSAFVLDQEGNLLAQAGDPGLFQNKTGLAPSLVAAFQANARVAQALSNELPQFLLCTMGAGASLCMLPVRGTQALLVVTGATLHIEQLGPVPQKLYLATLDLQQSVGQSGVQPPEQIKETPIHPPLQEAKTENASGDPGDLARLEVLLERAKRKELTPEDLDAFWESAVEATDAPEHSTGTLSYDQARQQGLTPE